MQTIGILLTNTGTPDALTTSAMRRYLREFLSDKRIVHLPRMVWLPILYGIILPFRPKQTLEKYAHIWQADGSPMRVFMQQIEAALTSSLHHTIVKIGMNYGNPSIASAVQSLVDEKVNEIIVLPLFPQYSNTSTGSSFDRVVKALQAQQTIPKMRWINQYCDHPAYIRALQQNIENHWNKHGKREHLLISFHGIPVRYATLGDPYPKQCETTAQLLAKALKLHENEWTLCYQSQFGYDRWLKPATQQLLQSLPAKGVAKLEVVCPGFSVDCLETLEEIAVTGRNTYLAAGGKTFHYHHALNEQVDYLQEILSGYLR